MPLPSQPPRAAVYVRLSRSTDESTSLASQRRECEQRVSAEGWSYDPAADLFSDDGRSAFSDRARPAYNALWQAIAAGKYDYVVVLAVDRFSRRWSQWGKIVDDLSTYKTGLVVLRQGLDTSKPGSEIALSLFASIAQTESKTLTARVKASREQIFLEGRWPGGNVPFGFASAPHSSGTGRTLVHHADQVARIRSAVQMVLEGASVHSIALAWNEEGYATQKGGLWHPGRLMMMLRNELLIGYRIERGERVVDPASAEPVVYYPPIVDVATWDRLQAKLAERATVRTKKEGSLLQGIAKCALCGSGMAGKSEMKHWHDSYECRRGYGQGPRACVGVTISGRRLEEEVVRWVLMLVSAAMIADLFRPDTAAGDSELAKMAHLRSLEVKRLGRLVESFASGDYEYPGGAAQYRAAVVASKAQIKKYDDASALHEPTVDERLRMAVGKDDADATRAEIVDGWDELERHQQRSIVSAVIERIEVHRPSLPVGMKGVKRDKRWYVEIDRVQVLLRGAERWISARSLFLHVRREYPVTGDHLAEAQFTYDDLVEWLAEEDRVARKSDLLAWVAADAGVPEEQAAAMVEREFPPYAVAREE